MTWNNTFIQTYQNMRYDSLHHQWACYKKKLDDRSYQGYFMEYADTKKSYFMLGTRSTIYYSQIPSFLVDEYTSCLSIEDKHTPGSLFLR